MTENDANIQSSFFHETEPLGDFVGKIQNANLDNTAE